MSPFTSMKAPQHREWAIGSVRFDRYHALAHAWDDSKSIIQQIRETLASGPLLPGVVTIAVAGSLGRMEASSLSDCDLIIVTEDVSEADVKSIQDAVWGCLGRLHLEPPNPRGVFSRSTTRRELFEKVGASDEPMQTFGKRLLLLLESQPVYGDDEYRKLIDAIVDRYAEGYVAIDATKEWTFLLNDLIRYFRGICVDYQWSFDSDHAKWPLRNVKLRHSRLVMYGGLLALLGEASKIREDKVTWLKERLALTPLERLAWVYGENKDWNFQRVAGLYDVFLARLSEKGARDQLRSGSQNDTYSERYKVEAYRVLKANSDALVAELLRFVMSRQDEWSERFFEYLIF